ncbi:MAG: SEL1-like repeat protein [Bacteroidota bacterium]|nr:SEL1-like repeat protein [Bacteroidota bacterium]
MKNRSTRGIIIFFAFLLLVSVFNGYAQQNLELKARSGNVTAMFKLAEEYYKGIGRLQDDRQAFIWYKQAADKGNLEGSYMVAYMYEAGKGCSQNYTNAFNYYMKAAERGHENSQLKVAIMFDAGLGTKRSLSRAYLWYRICAERNEGLAQRRIADCYLTGEVVEENWQEAVYWYEKAVDNQDTVAMAYLAYILSSNGAIAPNYAKADSLTKIALQKNIPMAEYVYALFLENGYEQKVNKKKAMEYYNKAAKGGILQAKEVVAIENYKKTNSITQILDLKQIYRAETYLILAQAYKEGKEVKKNNKKSLEYYRKAANMGSLEAQTYLENNKKRR